MDYGISSSNLPLEYSSNIHLSVKPLTFKYFMNHYWNIHKRIHEIFQENMFEIFLEYFVGQLLLMHKIVFLLFQKRFIEILVKYFRNALK